MKGTMEEVIEPALSMAFAIILAMVIGGVSFIFMDIFAREVSNKHPLLLSLQFAGITSAVASAPERAAYCYRVYPTVYMRMIWVKKTPTSPSVIFTGVSEKSSASQLYQGSETVYLGQMPQPYVVYNVFDVQKDEPFTIAMNKNETGLHVTMVEDEGACEALV